jgi:predicted TIM-barrel fold metal-dependent hydrolase
MRQCCCARHPTVTDGRPDGRIRTMNIDELIAIDVHTHAEVSCRQPEDDYANEIEEQKKKYFKSGSPPTIQETVDYYRERKIGLVMFTVDTEYEIGRRRIDNEEVLDAAKANSDVMIAFGSVDPHKGKMGLREVTKLIDAGVGGFKFHPTCQGFFPNDPMAHPFYALMNEARLPVIFHSGHSGMGSGLRGGGGLRLKYSNPMYLDDVAADFPDMTIIIAHPSWPWQDEALSVSLHKPNVYIDLSGWSPKYFPPQLIHYANTQLKHKMLFGTDYPLITPERWMKDYDAAGFRPEVRQGIVKDNAVRALGLAK